MKRHNGPCNDFCGCDDYAEMLADDREQGDPMTEGDWDRWESGPGWNYTPGCEPRNGW